MDDVRHRTNTKVFGTILEDVGRDVYTTHLMLSQRVDAMVGVIYSHILAPKGPEYGVDALTAHVHIGIVLCGPFGIDKVVKSLSNRVKTVQVVKNVEDNQISTALVWSFRRSFVGQKKSFFI